MKRTGSEFPASADPVNGFETPTETENELNILDNSVLLHLFTQFLGPAPCSNSAQGEGRHSEGEHKQEEEPEMTIAGNSIIVYYSNPILNAILLKRQQLL